MTAIPKPRAKKIISEIAKTTAKIITIMAGATRDFQITRSKAVTEIGM